MRAARINRVGEPLEIATIAAPTVQPEGIVVCVMGSLYRNIRRFL